MKIIIRFAYLLCVLTLLSACGGSGASDKKSSSSSSLSSLSSSSLSSSSLSSASSSSEATSSSSSSVAIGGNLTGVVKDFYSYSGVANAKIRVTAVQNEQSVLLDEVTADENGVFALSALPSDSTLILTAAVDSFGEQSVVIATGSELEFELTQDILVIPAAVEVSVSASLPVTLTNELDVDIVAVPANTLVRAGGGAPMGNINAKLTIINVSSNPELMPGNYSTFDSESGEMQAIESFGAINVVFADDEGNKLNLQSGATATIRIPVSAATNATSLPPATIPLFYFDEYKGYWVAEGEATLTEVNGELYYVGQVSHFSTWNADQIINTIYINGCVEDAYGQSVANAKITTRGLSYIGYSSIYTDESGNFSVAAKTNSSFLLSALLNTQSQFLKEESLESDLTLPTCLVLEQASSTIKLTWGVAPSDLDAHLVGPTENEGELFNLSYINEEVDIQGVLLWLDVDDVTSYGPEIITVSRFPLMGDYHYYVHHYAGTSTIAASPARVELLLNGVVDVFSPPQGDADECWFVFTIHVDENLTATLIPVNEWLSADECDDETFAPASLAAETGNSVMVSTKPSFQKVAKAKK